jgi:predicted DNA-binding protein with PD1-like motif
MMFEREVKPDRILMGNLDIGQDLLEALEGICRTHQIRLGHLWAIGAVQRACIGYYDQQKTEYLYQQIDRPLEITGLIGNISLKDGLPFIHAHLTLGDSGGLVFGGHLASGTVLFACEYMIQIFKGPEFNRTFQRKTGLSLWDSVE